MARHPLEEISEAFKQDIRDTVLVKQGDAYSLYVPAPYIKNPESDADINTNKAGPQRAGRISRVLEKEFNLEMPLLGTGTKTLQAGGKATQYLGVMLPTEVAEGLIEAKDDSRIKGMDTVELATAQDGEKVIQFNEVAKRGGRG